MLSRVILCTFLYQVIVIELFSRGESFTFPSVEIATNSSLYLLKEDINISCTGRHFENNKNATVIFSRETSSFDNFLLIESDKYTISVNGSTTSGLVESVLTIHEAVYGDSGVYRCTITDTVQEESDTVDIKVEGPPVIYKDDEATDGILGYRFELVCLVESEPELNRVIWFDGNDKPVDESDDFLILQNSAPFSNNLETILIIHTLRSELLGEYTCTVGNKHGEDSRTFNVTAEPALEISEPTSNLTKYNYGDQIVIKCKSRNVPLPKVRAGHIFNDEEAPIFIWRFAPVKGKAPVYMSGSQDRGNLFSIEEVMESDYLGYSTLTIWNTQFEYEGRYICARRIHGSELKDNIDIEVQGAPVLTSNTTRPRVLPTEDAVLTCNVTARPPAHHLEWTANGQPIDKNASRYEITEEQHSIYRTSTLVIYNVTISDYRMRYFCEAENEIGSNNLLFKIKDVNECKTNEHNCTREGFICVNDFPSYHCICAGNLTYRGDSCVEMLALTDDGPSLSTGAAIGVAFVVLALISGVAIFLIMLRKRKKGLTGPLTNSMIAQYKKNHGYIVKREFSDVDDLQLSNDTFPRSRLRFLNHLGEGKFGKVFKAEALSIRQTGNWETVAVKMWKDSCTDGEKEDFYHELMIVKKIPRHPNVVAFLGISKAEESESVLMIMEYLPGGDLLQYLRKMRSTKQTTSCMDDDDYTEPVPSSPDDLTEKELLRFGHHIARGMDHIASLNMVHRDVAARNILIDESKVCKISDFGLARETEGSDEYERTSKGPLPIRWMAIESLRDNIHTSKSDVWAYGVCLWEIATLGASPYPGQSSKMAMDAILAGEVLECPTHCRSEFYNVMKSCWSFDPDFRPTFSELVETLEYLLEEDNEYMMLDCFDEGTYCVIDDEQLDERL